MPNSTGTPTPREAGSFSEPSPVQALPQIAKAFEAGWLCRCAHADDDRKITFTRERSRYLESLSAKSVEPEQALPPQEIRDAVDFMVGKLRAELKHGDDDAGV